MLAGGNMSRCCRHVHLTTLTSTTTMTNTATWSGGRRVLSTAAFGGRISASYPRQTTQLSQSTPSLPQWLASLSPRTAFISTSNKKPPVKSSPAAQTSSVPAAAGSTKADNSNAASTGPKYAYPERLIIYHAGTGSKFSHHISSAHLTIQATNTSCVRNHLPRHAQINHHLRIRPLRPLGLADLCSRRGIYTPVHRE